MEKIEFVISPHFGTIFKTTYTVLLIVIATKEIFPSGD